MQLKKLRETQDVITWAPNPEDLPVISWDSCQSRFLFFASASRPYSRFRLLVQQQAAKRPLIIIAGFIHDVGAFLDEHPGGRHLLTKNIGRDATTAFFGGVYDHSNAAHNVRPALLFPMICFMLITYLLYTAALNVPRRCSSRWYATRARR